MPFSSNHILYTAHGQLPGGEVWSCGLRTVAATVPENQLQSYADYAAYCWGKAWVPDSGIGLSDINTQQVVMDGVTARQVNIAGVTMYQAEGMPTTNARGTATSGAHPNQVALALTLITPRAGRSGRGRIYLPANRLAISTNGQNDTGVTNQLIGNLALMLSWIGGYANVPGPVPEPAAPYAISVQSRTKPGQALPVNQCAIGSVADTIRGRRNKLRESYVYSSVVLDEDGV